MMYERKQQMREKYLKDLSCWFLGTIKKELNLFELWGNTTVEDLHNEHDKTLAYWRQNRRQYPRERVWNKYYFNLLNKSFESRHELQAWCEVREKKLKDPVYLEE
jgi:hypothetical protein